MPKLQFSLPRLLLATLCIAGAWCALMIVFHPDDSYRGPWGALSIVSACFAAESLVADRR